MRGAQEQASRLWGVRLGEKAAGDRQGGQNGVPAVTTLFPEAVHGQLWMLDWGSPGDSVQEQMGALVAQGWKQALRAILPGCRWWQRGGGGWLTPR